MPQRRHPRRTYIGTSDPSVLKMWLRKVLWDLGKSNPTINSIYYRLERAMSWWYQPRANIWWPTAV
jgi:hypothetical protein